MKVTMLLLSLLGVNPETTNMQYEFVHAKNVPVEECIAQAELINTNDAVPFLVVCQNLLPDEAIELLNSKNGVGA